MAENNGLIVGVYLIALVVKVLLIPTYRSTDFEVHRNWLAITHSKSYGEWYSDGASASEWTLDYPPLFAWFEWALSQCGALVDPGMVNVENLGYESDATIVFQRLTVIITEIVLVLGVLFAMHGTSSSKKALAVFLVAAHPGLYIVDHIHFQYNWMLLGLLVFSIYFATYGNDVLATATFTVLLCMKHLFLYVAPAFGAYYLGLLWDLPLGQSVTLFSKLSVVAVSVLAVSFGPFIGKGMLPQIISRLFPIQRGLVHAYWAPNFWALYAGFDKGLSIILPRIGMERFVSTTKANLTGGLVGVSSFSVLPEVTSPMTFIIAVCAMIPALFHIIRRPFPGTLVETVVYCSLCSFLFGYHVHEKAILMTLIPMAIMVAKARHGDRMAGSYIFLTTIGTYSLFPLLTEPQEYLIKVFLLLTYLIIAVPWLMREGVLSTTASPSRLEKIYLMGIVPLELYCSFGHGVVFKDQWPFIPLMLISVYSAVGIVYAWGFMAMSYIGTAQHREKIKTS